MVARDDHTRSAVDRPLRWGPVAFLHAWQKLLSGAVVRAKTLLSSRDSGTVVGTLSIAVAGAIAYLSGETFLGALTDAVLLSCLLGARALALAWAASDVFVEGPRNTWATSLWSSPLLIHPTTKPLGWAIAVWIIASRKRSPEVGRAKAVRAAVIAIALEISIDVIGWFVGTGTVAVLMFIS